MVKSGKSRLQIILQHADHRHGHHHTPPSSTVPIHFVCQTGQRFLDKERKVLLGAQQEFKGEKELLVDHRFFFQFQQGYNSYMAISAILENFGVKYSLRFPITKHVLDFGRRLKVKRNKKKKKKKKKMFLGIVVSLISVDTFLGDQASLHGYMQRSIQKNEAS